LLNASSEATDALSFLSTSVAVSVLFQNVGDLSEVYKKDCKTQMSTVKRMKYRPRVAGSSRSKTRSNKLRFVSKDGEKQEINVEDIRENLQYLKENKDLHVKNIAPGSELERQFNTFRTRCDLLYKTDDYARLMSIVKEVFSDTLLHPGTIGAYIAGDFAEDVGKGFQGPEKYNPIRAPSTPSANNKPVEKVDKRILLYYPETDGKLYQIAGTTAEDAYVFVYLSGKPVGDISIDSSSLKSSGVKNVYVYTYNEASREFADITQKQDFVAADSAPSIKTASDVQRSVERAPRKPSSQSTNDASAQSTQQGASWLTLLLVLLVLALLAFGAYYFLASQ
jgi:hypothetical protein